MPWENLPAAVVVGGPAGALVYKNLNIYDKDR
jgi:hypothetical protein